MRCTHYVQYSLMLVTAITSSYAAIVSRGAEKLKKPTEPELKKLDVWVSGKIRGGF